MKKFCELETSLGVLTIIEENQKIIEINFGRIEKEENETWKKEETELLKETKRQLVEYFNKTRTEFEIPCAPKGTEFQRDVWEELQKIPYGETRTYQEIAFSIGNVRACRSVGLANHKNPIPIIIPCHRVIGKNNKLLGYAGGMKIKEFLLQLERKSIRLTKIKNRN